MCEKDVGERPFLQGGGICLNLLGPKRAPQIVEKGGDCRWFNRVFKSLGVF